MFLCGLEKARLFCSPDYDSLPPFYFWRTEPGLSLPSVHTPFGPRASRSPCEFESKASPVYDVRGSPRHPFLFPNFFVLHTECDGHGTGLFLFNYSWGRDESTFIPWRFGASSGYLRRPDCGIGSHG